MYYRLEGKEVIETSGDEWMGARNSPAESLWRTVLHDGTMISTIFLSVTPRKDSIGRPLVFETMVFGGEYSGYTRIHHSYDDAEACHQQTIEMLFEV